MIKLQKLLLIGMLLLTACSQHPFPPQNEGSLEPAYAVQLGNVLDVTAARDAVNPAIAIDNVGSPIATWTEKVFDDGISQDYDVYVKRWNFDRWQTLGDRLDLVASAQALDPDIATDNQGRPSVVWREGSNIYVKRYEGSSWQQLGGALNTNSASDPRIAVDFQGNPIVAYIEYDGTSWNVYVKRWNLGSWQDLGGALDRVVSSNAFRPPIAVDNQGNPSVAWWEQTSTSDNVYVKRWNVGTWQSLGNILDKTASNNAYNPDIAVDNVGNPVVTWWENGDIFVKRWAPVVSRWQLLGSKPLDRVDAKCAFDPAIAVNFQGTPLVTWEEEAGACLSNNHIYAKYWTGNLWESLSAKESPDNVYSFDRARANHVEDPAIAVDNQGTAYLTWGEKTSTSYNIYVKKCCFFDQ